MSVHPMDEGRDEDRPPTAPAGEPEVEIRPEPAARQPRPAAAPPAASAPGESPPNYRGVATDERTEGILRELAERKRLAEWFTASVTDEVDRRAIDREGRRERQQTKIFTILGLIGVAGATGFIRASISSEVQAQEEKFARETLPDKIRSELQSSLDESTSELRDQIRTEADYQQFAYLVVMLQNEKGFTDDHRDNIMKLLRSISAAGTQAGRPEFPALLEKTIDPFASSGNDERVDEVVELFPLETRNTKGIVITLATHYGRRLAGHVLGPGPEHDSLETRFVTFEKAAKSFHVEEASLPYRILVESKEATDAAKDRTGLLIEEARGLRPTSSSAEVLLELIMVADPNHYWDRVTPTAEASELARASKHVLDEYEMTLAGFLQSPEVVDAMLKRAQRTRPISETYSDAILAYVDAYAGLTDDE